MGLEKTASGLLGKINTIKEWEIKEDRTVTVRQERAEKSLNLNQEHIALGKHRGLVLPGDGVSPWEER